VPRRASGSLHSAKTLVVTEMARRTGVPAYLNSHYGLDGLPIDFGLDGSRPADQSRGYPLFDGLVGWFRRLRRWTSLLSPHAKTFKAARADPGSDRRVSWAAFRHRRMGPTFGCP